MPLVTPRPNKSFKITRTSPISTQAYNYALRPVPSNISYSSNYNSRVPQDTASQYQNQSNWSPDTVSNFTFGIAMFVVAAIGIFIQSCHCRYLALTCLRIPQEPVSKTVQNDNAVVGGEQFFPPEEAEHKTGAEMEEKIMERVRNWLKTRFRNTESQRSSLDWEQVDVEKSEDFIKSVSRMKTGLKIVEEASEDIGCYKNFQVEV